VWSKPPCMEKLMWFEAEKAAQLVEEGADDEENGAPKPTRNKAKIFCRDSNIIIIWRQQKEKEALLFLQDKLLTITIGLSE